MDVSGDITTTTEDQPTITFEPSTVTVPHPSHVSDVISHDGADSGIDVINEVTLNTSALISDRQAMRPMRNPTEIYHHLPNATLFHPDPDIMKPNNLSRAEMHSNDAAQDRLIRLATVSARQRMRNIRRGSLLSDSTFKMPGKLITWHAAMESRPPLRIDMSGPSPTTYSPRNKPLYETNAPAYSFGRKETEKDGCGQKAWGKLWFRSDSPFTHKTNYELKWPTLSHYEHKSTIGPRQVSKPEYPSHSIGIRRSTHSIPREKLQIPASNQYVPEISRHLVSARSPAFSMGFRIPSGQWVKKFNVPAPNVYSLKSSSPMVKRCQPAFTMNVQRRYKRHDIGPFTTL